ncbi:hypothetical protein BJY00DRAFT_279200 [Aspergillus carlsbadensis]|nr:hypothetical protein BJY00DRAFT_279200 [Aspergillus carlsbadensis]
MIVIDQEKDSFSGTIVEQDFPHESFPLRRVDDKLRLGLYKDGPWYQKYLSKIRTFTYDLYPWGCTIQDLRNASRAAAPTGGEG